MAREHSCICMQQQAMQRGSTFGIEGQGAYAPEEQAEQCMPLTSSLTVCKPVPPPALLLPAASRRLLTMRASNPQSSTAASTASALCTAQSIRTSADSLSKATSALSTPGSALRSGARRRRGGPRGGRSGMGQAGVCAQGTLGQRCWSPPLTDVAAGCARIPLQVVSQPTSQPAIPHTNLRADSTADEQELQCMPLIESCTQQQKERVGGSDHVWGGSKLQHHMPSTVHGYAGGKVNSKAAP